MAPTIAVIPFAPRRMPDDHHVIGELLAEEIIRALSRSRDLNVISRLSTTAFRGRDATLEEIGSRLHADYVLSGAYSSDEQHITLDAELAEKQTLVGSCGPSISESISAILIGEQELIDRLVAEVLVPRS